MKNMGACSVSEKGVMVFVLVSCLHLHLYRFQMGDELVRIGECSLAFKKSSSSINALSTPSSSR